MNNPTLGVLLVLLAASVARPDAIRLAQPSEAEPAPAPPPPPAPDSALSTAPAAQLPTDLPGIIKLLCDHYRDKPFAERIKVSFSAPGKREQQSTLVVRSRGSKPQSSRPADPASGPEVPIVGPELFVEASPLLLRITPLSITVLPARTDLARPIYWSTPVATGSGTAPPAPRNVLPTHNELGRLVAPLPLPQLALMQPDAADRFLSSEGLSLLFQLPGAQAQSFTSLSGTIAGRAQIGSRSNPAITQTSGWSMTLFPQSARLRSLTVAYAGGTLVLSVTPLDGDAAAADPTVTMSTSGRRRVAELAELGRTLTIAGPEDAAMALGDLALTTPGKVSSPDGAPSPKKLAQLVAGKKGPLVLMIHRPSLDATKSSVGAAREATESIEQLDPGQTQVLRLAGADAALATPEPVLIMSNQQLDRLLGDYEAVLVAVSAGPECTVLDIAGVLPGQSFGSEVIARLSRLLQAP